ncbi:hypothetical protein OG747_21225 [Streptomyces sp. NBC_01384]|uniref:hypothetical protein n=1 Tax=Streptomyces sp. NBC_01384 TaxID=2903847 RepID=UPI00324676EF
MNRHRRSLRPSAEAEAERLREVFTEAAYDVTPSAVPLAAIERAGRLRKRRRTTAVVGSACALLVIPLAVVALREALSSGPGAEHLTSPTAVRASPSAAPKGTVRVVTPGERVKVSPDIKIWLTEDGQHWSSPGNPGSQFRSVTDGNLDLSGPGVGVQQEGAGGYEYFLSGIYHGKGDAARVEIDTAGGAVVNGTVLTLAGGPHWGVWYAMVSDAKAAESDRLTSIARRVTVYDSAGGVVASTEATR